MRTKRRVASGLLAALLLLPVPFTALPMFAQGETVRPQASAGTGKTISASQAITVSRRQLRRHQAFQRIQLNAYFSRVRALLRIQQRLERQLGVASPFVIPSGGTIPIGF